MYLPHPGLQWLNHSGFFVDAATIQVGETLLTAQAITVVQGANLRVDASRTCFYGYHGNRRPPGGSDPGH